MTDATPHHPSPARNVSLLVAGAVLVELVFTVFLFFMAGMASQSSGETGKALMLGAVTSVVAAGVGAWLWASARSARAGIATPVWVARVLPLVATGAAAVAAAADVVPWLAAPLALFAPAPVCVVALVVPQLLAAARASGAGASRR